MKTFGTITATLGAVIVLASSAAAQTDLQGIWQVRNTANWDVQHHSGSYKTPAGLSVVVDPPDGIVPYQPWALEKKKENFQARETGDPLEKCYLAGIPRTMYLPYPIQIFQTSDEVIILSEYVHTMRWIPLKKLARYAGYESWMGDPRGQWEGKTLVVESIGFNDPTWFDNAGNFHSDALKTVERFTRTAPDAITYEVTIEDPKVFTRPWTMRMPLYLSKDVDRLLENECHLYAEEVGKPIRGTHPKDR